MQNKTIHSYSLKHRLGEGGMAEVWYAENSIGKKAAVKILKEEFTKMSSVLERFKNEAKVMVTLSHPHIRQVYDYGEIESRPCIVMEYLEGADLSDRLKRGERFSEAQLGEWWDNMVDILHYTRQQGVVHRDIKPSNIFITKEGELKLLDFGIAKIKSSITLTQTGNRMGTLMYMSPEQVRDSKHLDYRSDAYSLAVTFYHLVNGKAPYDNHTDSEFDIQMKIVSEILDVSVLPTKWQNLLAPLLVKEVEKRGKLLKSGEVIVSNGDKTRIIPKSQPKPEINSEPQPKPQPEIEEQQKKKIGLWIGIVAVVIAFVVVGTVGLKKEEVSYNPNTENIDTIGIATGTVVDTIGTVVEEISVTEAENFYKAFHKTIQLEDYDKLKTLFAKNIVKFHQHEDISPDEAIEKVKGNLEKHEAEFFEIDSFNKDYSYSSEKFRYKIKFHLRNKKSNNLLKYRITGIIGLIREDGDLKINYINDERTEKLN